MLADAACDDSTSRCHERADTCYRRHDSCDAGADDFTVIASDSIVDAICLVIAAADGDGRLMASAACAGTVSATVATVYAIRCVTAWVRRIAAAASIPIAVIGRLLLLDDMKRAGDGRHLVIVEHGSGFVIVDEDGVIADRVDVGIAAKLELDLIDYGADEVFEEVDEDDNREIIIYGEYTAFNNIQKYIEDHGYELLSGEFTRLPNVELKDVAPEDRAELDKLVERLEEDDDVQNVYHTMKPLPENE